MKILFILNGSYSGYSGGDLHTIMVGNQLASNPNNIVEFYIASNSSPKILEMLHEKILLIGNKNLQKRKSQSILCISVGYSYRILRALMFFLIKKPEYDIAVASSHFAFDSIPLFAVRNVKSKNIYWHHHVESVTRSKSPKDLIVMFIEWMTIKLLRIYDVRVLTSNTVTKQFLLSKGLSGGNVLLTINGLSPYFEIQFADGASIEKKPSKSFLFCGRVSLLKGAKDFVSIAESILEFDSDAEFHVIGSEGDYSNQLLTDLASEIEQGIVTIHGFVDEETKFRLFKEAHSLIFPSYEEGWGVTVGEALSTGCWVFVYDLPAVLEAFPNKLEVSKTGDWQSMARAVKDKIGIVKDANFDVVPMWRQISEHDLKLFRHYE